MSQEAQFEKFNFLQKAGKNKPVYVLTYTIKLGMLWRGLVLHCVVSPARSYYTVGGPSTAFREVFLGFRK